MKHQGTKPDYNKTFTISIFSNPDTIRIFRVSKRVAYASVLTPLALTGILSLPKPDPTNTPLPLASLVDAVDTTESSSVEIGDSVCDPNAFVGPLLISSAVTASVPEQGVSTEYLRVPSPDVGVSKPAFNIDRGAVDVRFRIHNLGLQQLGGTFWVEVTGRDSNGAYLEGVYPPRAADDGSGSKLPTFSARELTKKSVVVSSDLRKFAGVDQVTVVVKLSTEDQPRRFSFTDVR